MANGRLWLASRTILTHGCDEPATKGQHSMHLRSKILTVLGALAIGTALASGNIASTASNDMPASTAGYGEAAVSGATANSVAYGLSPDGRTITTATIVF